MKEKERRTPTNTLEIDHINIPNHVLFNSELTVRERVLYGVLKYLADKSEDGYTYVSNVDLSDVLAVDPQIVSNGVATLRDLDLVAVEYKVPSQDGYEYQEYNGGEVWSRSRRIRVK